MSVTTVEFERIYLNETAWVDKGVIEDLVDFEDLWNIHPAEKGRVVMMGQEIETPRYQQTYGREYTFSGMNHPALDWPDEAEPFITWADSLDYGEFNQMLMNWYPDGLSYIGAHSDDEHQLVKNSPIVSIALGVTRKFRFRKKGVKGVFMDIEMPHGTVLVMGGTCQRDFTHEVVKINGKKGEDVGRRINLTFRQFK